MEDLAFGSTSADEGLVFTQETVDTVLDLTVSPRVKALWGANPREAELFLQRGCRYAVESVEKEADQWRVKATVLPPK